MINYGAGNNSTGRSSSGTSIAVFSDDTSYTNYKEKLEQDAEAWDDAFLAQWSHLDDDALNAKEEELNFDSDKPLTDFENSIGLQSLRKKYLDEEAIWLRNNILDETTDPDAKSIYSFDVEEMTLLNTYSEVQIGTTIYKQLNKSEIESISLYARNSNTLRGDDLPTVDKSTFIAIEEEDYNTLIKFNDGDASVIEQDNVTVSTTNTSPVCKSGKTRRKFFNTFDNKKIKAIIKVPQPKFGWNGKVKTKIKSYRKVWYGWKKWRTKIAPGADGRVYSNCGEFFDIDMQMTQIKRKKKRVFVWRNPSYANHQVENGKMIGLYYQNGITKELALTW